MNDRQRCWMTEGRWQGFGLCGAPYRRCQSPGSWDRGLCLRTWPSCPRRWFGCNPWISSGWPACGEKSAAVLQRTDGSPSDLETLYVRISIGQDRTTHCSTAHYSTLTKVRCSWNPSEIRLQDEWVSYLSVQLGQLLLIQIGLFVHPGLVSKLNPGEKKRKETKS